MICIRETNTVRYLWTDWWFEILYQISVLAGSLLILYILFLLRFFKNKSTFIYFKSIYETINDATYIQYIQTEIQ